MVVPCQTPGQNPALGAYKGSLWKLSTGDAKWRKHFFVVDRAEGGMAFWDSEAFFEERRKPEGAIELSRCALHFVEDVERRNSHEHTHHFTIADTRAGHFVLATDTAEELSEWVRRLREVIAEQAEIAETKDHASAGILFTKRPPARGYILLHGPSGLLPFHKAA